MGYLNARQERIQDLAWRTGKNLPEHLKEKFSPEELKFYEKYCKLIEEVNE